GHLNLGCVQRLSGRIDSAIASFETAIGLRPDFAQAHFNLALALLMRGELSRGWEELEWRLQPPGANRTARIHHAIPAWRGELLGGRSILLHAEQGFGDAIQFARYVPMVADRGGRIILMCRPALRRLFERLRGVEQVIEPGPSVPRVDVQCPFMSLPRAFGTTLESIPADVPYLSPPPELIDTWKAKLDGISGMKVGFAWAGSRTNTRDRYRSCRLDDLAPLFEVSGVTFVNLQKGEAGSTLPTGILDPTGDLHDWADTAALLANLDLVISVDTAIVHLAGAMGKPVWTLLSAAGEWRWLRDRTDTSWYPTMRLWRQKTLGEWEELMGRVAAELRSMDRR
ncbi:MAG: tetratricopeptide repeat protein, partial [Tepidisphaeraceae bacterium]